MRHQSTIKHLAQNYDIIAFFYYPDAIMLIYFNGLLLGLSLIMALGPQNVFLIRQGARKNHAALSAVICFFVMSFWCAAVSLDYINCFWLIQTCKSGWYG